MVPPMPWAFLGARVSPASPPQLPEAWEMDFGKGKLGQGSALCWSLDVTKVARGGSARSLENCAGGQRQRLSSLRTRHWWHCTTQHQWKRHRQFSSSCTLSWRCPRPQHSRSQPLRSRALLLQARPRVPGEPVRRLGAQKSGESAT